MQIHRGYWSLPKAALHGVVAIGNFDGVHRGHRALIEAAAARAQEQGAPLGVVTFEPHPREVLAPDQAPPRLTPLRVKARLLADLGVAHLFALAFNEHLMTKSPEAFVHDVLAGGLGDPPRRGRLRLPLRPPPRRRRRHARQARRGVRLRRDAHRAGRLARRSLLVEPGPRRDRRGRRRARARPARPSVSGRGPGGRGRPARPRARLSDREPAARPARPVAGRRHLCGARHLGGRRPGRGTMPSPASACARRSGAATGCLEIHLFDQEVDLYGRRLCCAFIERLRAEAAFATIDDLKAQMDRDCAAAPRGAGRGARPTRGAPGNGGTRGVS